MKKLGIMTMILLLFTTSFPQSLFANEAEEADEVITNSEEEQVIEQDDEEVKSLIESTDIEEGSPSPNIDKEEYNEFGIKKGTMVNGEDISELSEWELQYIPEGWRDGIVESEHPEEELPNQSIMGAKKSYPNVNNYINSKKFKVAKVQYDHKNFFTKFNYRGGFGKVEGVVAHETANNTSNIAGEIAYMSRNHKNAFVHAFVDHSQIIEIHPPELGAWGAGRFANQRFIHVELVRVHSFDQFAQSINNYSDYLANLLYKHNLGVKDADNNNGQGTLWSHGAVSKFLGGTTHGDPHGYFASWGYNWNDFVKLVRSKHNALVANKKQYTSKLGHIKLPTARIYKDPMNQSEYTSAGSGNSNEVFYIKQEAVVSGKRYYMMSRQPSNSNGTIGWMNAADVNVHEHAGSNKKITNLTIRSSGKAYNKTWGGSKNLVYNDLNSFIGATFNVNLIETVGKNTWYRGRLQGKQVWVHSSVFEQSALPDKSDNVPQESSTSKIGHIRNVNVRIYEKSDDKSPSVVAGSGRLNQAYYIKKQAKLYGQDYYLISNNASSVNGVLGWVKAQDLSTHNHAGMDRKAKTFYFKGTGSTYSTAWGGSKDLVHKNIATYKNQAFAVHLTEKVGNNVWYRGKLDGKTMWIHSSYVVSAQESTTSKLGHIRNSNVKIYPKLGVASTAIVAGQKHTNAVYYIKKEAKVNGDTFTLISSSPSSTKGVLGWVNAKDMSTHLHAGVDRKAKKLYFKGTGSAFDTAWGGSQNSVFKDLTSQKDQVFNIHLTEKIGNNIWYRGNLNGKTVWVHQAYLTNK